MNWVIPPALAIATAIACSAVWGEPTDWEITGSKERICAKDASSCESAVYAINRGWLFRDLAWSTTPRCVPSPRGCFPDVENVIRGYND